MSRSVVIEALLTKLRTDTGAGSLVALTGHTSSAQRIVWAPKRVVAQYPALGVHIQAAIPLNKEVTTYQTYFVHLTAYGKREPDAIRIADRVERLFHNVGGSNRSYYDFSGSTIAVKSTRFVRRTQIKYDNDLDHWQDANYVEIVANAFIGCT